MKSENQKYKVAVIQMAMGDDTNENLRKAITFVKDAADKDAKVICLPELFRTKYFCQSERSKNFNSAETIPGNSTHEIGKAAKEKNVTVIVPLFEKRTIGIYHNSTAVINELGKVSGIYRKMHIPDDPGYYEKYYFTPGDLGYKSFETKYGKIGTLICWDQWYPEAARLTALKGANIIFYPTAIGWHPDEKAKHGKLQYESWLTVQRGHAIANGVYVAAANRIGLEKLQDDSAGIEFWGQSFICDPQGVILAQASADKEEIIYTEVDPDRIEIVRRNWPFFRDRRIDSYGEITKRFLDG
ncbi:N-carbamoyl-D-amino acid hydrolase [bacterium BMS3Abin03]|nr:N-carbamoyl-D-amino acid hydrolase [bacterium BMS3Abin03]